MTCVNEIKNICVLVVVCCKSNSSSFAQKLFSPNNAVCVNCTWAMLQLLYIWTLIHSSSILAWPCLLVFLSSLSSLWSSSGCKKARPSRIIQCQGRLRQRQISGPWGANSHHLVHTRIAFTQPFTLQVSPHTCLGSCRRDQYKRK